MSIGIRVECDVPDCGRHFEADGVIDLAPRAQLGPDGHPYAVFAVPFLALPADWTAASPPEGQGLQIYCADHAEAAALRCAVAEHGVVPIPEQEA